MTTIRSEARLQQTLDGITRLLDKHRVLDTLVSRQEGPKRDLLENLQHRQNLAELHKRVRAMHAADLAFVLETLPLALGAVMTSAVVLNLVVAAIAGVAIPLGLHATGRDPAYGSSVLLTFVTDAMGFFLFLGLATVILF